MSRKKPQTETLYVRCECSSQEHFVVFDYDQEFGDFCFHVYLYDHKSFFGRLWEGLKYIFGYKSKYGHFDEILLKADDCTKIKNLLNLKESFVQVPDLKNN